MLDSPYTDYDNGACYVYPAGSVYGSYNDYVWDDSCGRQYLSPDLSGNISEGGVYFVYPGGDIIFNTQTISYGTLRFIIILTSHIIFIHMGMVTILQMILVIITIPYGALRLPRIMAELLLICLG